MDYNTFFCFEYGALIIMEDGYNHTQKDQIEYDFAISPDDIDNLIKAMEKMEKRVYRYKGYVFRPTSTLTMDDRFLYEICQDGKVVKKRNLLPDLTSIAACKKWINDRIGGTN